MLRHYILGYEAIGIYLYIISPYTARYHRTNHWLGIHLFFLFQTYLVEMSTLWKVWNGPLTHLLSDMMNIYEFHFLADADFLHCPWSIPSSTSVIRNRLNKLCFYFAICVVWYFMSIGEELCTCVGWVAYMYTCRVELKTERRITILNYFTAKFILMFGKKAIFTPKWWHHQKES